MATRSNYQIDIDELKKFLANVPEFPVDAGSLADLASKSDVPDELLQFFSDIDPLTTLETKEDVLTRAEEINVLHSQQADDDHATPEVDEHEID